MAPASASSTPGQAQAPLSIKDLADVAESTLVWDPDQPIERYIKALRQLLSETKVYQREGNYDRAFVYCVKIHKLTSELLPHRHPEYHRLSEDMKRSLHKDSNTVSAQMSDLRLAIMKRSEEWERNNALAASRSASPNPRPNHQPALTLKNTVQRASSTMGSSVDPGLVPATQPKLGKAAKLRKAFGGPKVGKGKDREMPVGAGVLSEPGAEDDGEEDERGWTMVGNNTGQGAPKREDSREYERAREQTYRRDENAYQRSATPSRQMPMPGEDDEDEADSTSYHSNSIAYAPATSYGNPQQPQQWLNHRPPSMASIRSHTSDYTTSAVHSPAPSAPAWSAPVDIYAQVHSTFQQAQPPPQIQHYSQQVPPPLQSWASYNSVPYAQPGPPPVSRSVGGLQRSPSRLTTAHQEQQGYIPSQTMSHVTAQYAAPAAPLSYHPIYNSAPTPPVPPSHPPPQSYQGFIPPPNSSLPSISVPQQQSYYPVPPPQGRYPSPAPASPSYAPPSHDYVPHRAPPAIPQQQAPAPPKSPSVIQVSSYAVPPPQGAYPSSTTPSAPSGPADHSPAPPLAPSAPSPSPTPPASNNLIRSASMAALPPSLTKRMSRRRRDEKGLDSLSVMSETLEEEEVLQTTEGGLPLRNVVLPGKLMGRFVELASENTERGIETCGLLMGTLSHNTFTITNLLIPKQEGTPDTCTTTHEEEQFAYQDELDLMTLGWIHTHPTQSCFMSSLDLHTHASYQVMLAEAIAIVCAPKHDPSYGIFRLTDPPGLETIVKCSRPGMFHPHPDLPIYTDTDHGHVQVRGRLDVKCDDLRKK
ncbi:Mov34-domain-containing protein [Meredithblackwellia eburnea MCA 4105]